MISSEWFLAGLGSGATLIALLITLWSRAKPIIDVYFENGEKEIICQPNESVTLNFLFENKGRRTLIFGIRKKETVQDLSIMVYFPLNFKIEEAERQGQKTSRIFISPLKGKLAGKQYIFVPDPLDRRPPVMTSLRFKETEGCKIKIQTPNQAGEYEILFDMGSRQGDLGLSKVVIKVISD